MDPGGEYERERTDACVSVVRSSPTAAGTVWGRIDSLPVWLQHACSTRWAGEDFLPFPLYFFHCVIYVLFCFV